MQSILPYSILIPLCAACVPSGEFVDFKDGDFSSVETATTTNADSLSALEARLTALEEQTEAMNNKLPPLTEFVIPGGSLPTAQAHLCRTICRRAETDLWGTIGVWEKRLGSAQAARPRGAGSYLNRLSDFFFVLARTLGQSQSQTELQWHGPSNS